MDCTPFLISDVVFWAAELNAEMQTHLSSLSHVALLGQSLEGMQLAHAALTNVQQVSDSERNLLVRQMIMHMPTVAYDLHQVLVI
jgi:hypothetical protein